MEWAKWWQNRGTGNIFVIAYFASEQKWRGVYDQLSLKYDKQFGGRKKSPHEIPL